MSEFFRAEPAQYGIDITWGKVSRIDRTVYIGVLIAAVDRGIAVFVADALRGAGFEVDGVGQAVAGADLDARRTCTEGQGIGFGSLN